MSSADNTFTLRSGTVVPAIAFGTGTRWFKYGAAELDENLVSAVLAALEAGYTHLDAAEVYNVGVEVGMAIKRLKVPRSRLFVTDKYFSGGPEFEPPRSAELDPYAALVASLRRMQLDYVDLYLLHFPYISKNLHGFSLREAWKYMEQLVDDGLAKNIGVSNFTVQNLHEILGASPKYPPAVHQIEYLAYLQDQTPGIVDFCKQHGILVEGYSSLGPITKGFPGPLDPLLSELAGKYHKTPAQILLRWVLDTGVLPITTTSRTERMREFLQVLEFKLRPDDVDAISALGKLKILRQYSTEYAIFD